MQWLKSGTNKRDGQEQLFIIFEQFRYTSLDVLTVASFITSFVFTHNHLSCTRMVSHHIHVPVCVIHVLYLERYYPCMTSIVFMSAKIYVQKKVSSSLIDHSWHRQPEGVSKNLEIHIIYWACTCIVLEPFLVHFYFFQTECCKQHVSAADISYC